MKNQQYKEIMVLAEIRSALGVNEKPMLSELPEIARRIKQNADRYEKVRRLNPQQFSGLWMKALTGKATFDELIDAWIDKPALNDEKQET